MKKNVQGFTLERYILSSSFSDEEAVAHELIGWGFEHPIEARISAGHKSNEGQKADVFAVQIIVRKVEN